MIRLWVRGAECTVPQDLQIEFTYNTNDADGLETQCSHYSTSFALPRTAENIAIFTPLFDIHTIFGSASFDIHANAPAIIEVTGQTSVGYVKMEAIDESFHLRFIDGAGQLLEALRNMKISELPDELNIYMPFYYNYTQWQTTYEDLYGSGDSKEYYVLFPAFSEGEETFESYIAGTANSGDDTLSGQFKQSYFTTEAGYLEEKTRFFAFTEHQARIYRKSHLRCACQVKHLFERIMSASGFTADYTTKFFKQSNPYWANLHMVMRQRFDVPYTSSDLYKPSSYMPDMTCEDFILGYCKLFGLRIEVSGTKVHFYTREEWYDIYNIIDISEGVDMRKGITVKPNAYSDKTYGAFLDCMGKPCGKNAGVVKATNIYEGLPFKYCEDMEYVGPGVTSWLIQDTATTKATYCDEVTEVSIELPYLDSQDGGELLFRNWNNNPNMPSFYFMDDWLGSPATELSIGQSVMPTSTKMIASPGMSSFVNMYMSPYPLYTYKESQLYNYTYQKAIAPQDAFSKFFQDYFAEICSKDNVMLEMEGYFTPDQIAQLASCKSIVNLRGAFCRIIECVTNRIDHCKLTLQKINDKSQLIMGQLFSGYYLRIVGYIWVRSTDTIGQQYTLPVETNDTITSFETGLLSWSSASPYVATLAQTPTATRISWGLFSNVAEPQWDELTVRTNSGLDGEIPSCEYDPDCVISYGYNPGIAFVGTGGKSIRAAMLAYTGGQYAVRVRDAISSILWQDNANYAISVTRAGVLRVTAKDATYSHVAAVCVTIESLDGSTVYAKSEVIPIQTDPA